MTAPRIGFECDPRHMCISADLRSCHWFVIVTPIGAMLSDLTDSICLIGCCRDSVLQLQWGGVVMCSHILNLKPMFMDASRCSLRPLNKKIGIKLWFVRSWLKSNWLSSWFSICFAKQGKSQSNKMTEHSRWFLFDNPEDFTVVIVNWSFSHWEVHISCRVSVKANIHIICCVSAFYS